MSIRAVSGQSGVTPEIKRAAHFEATAKDPQEDGELLAGLGADGADDVDRQAVLADLEGLLEQRGARDRVEHLADKVVGLGRGEELRARVGDDGGVVGADRRRQPHGRAEATVPGRGQGVGDAVEGLGSEAGGADNGARRDGDSRGGAALDDLGRRGLGGCGGDTTEEGQRPGGQD